MPSLKWETADVHIGLCQQPGELLFVVPLAPPLGELPQCAHWG